MTDQSDQETTFRRVQGINARKRGKYLEDNPYKFGSCEWKDWHDGWMTQEWMQQT